MNTLLRDGRGPAWGWAALFMVTGALFTLMAITGAVRAVLVFQGIAIATLTVLCFHLQKIAAIQWETNLALMALAERRRRK